MELRRSNRYQLGATAFFWWERSDGHLQESKGIDCVSNAVAKLMSSGPGGIWSITALSFCVPPASNRQNVTLTPWCHE